MSTEQPESDPFRKPDQSGGEGAPPPPPPPSNGGGAAGPYAAGPYGGGPYDGGPYGDNPYGGTHGAADPLAGMPPLASRGKRLVARIIDAVIIGVPVALVVGLSEGGYSTDSGQTYWQQAVYTLAYFIYEGLMLTTRGQTVGKMAMKIRVGMLANGAVPAGSPGWFRAATYSLPALVPCLGFLFWLVNVLFCTWDKPYQQCVHDKAARSVVVATG
ncbi:RDD family protein [Streptomyces boncukensis]|uniref:RDD family protein n=1 Tax=Streptomyces boncukensis TaxID=2711219 RepID=A0A6G4X6Q0_9ACTN|nr:RDD family protein [Streptomyces boncukensis]NGO72933.1 RDD family protein [Streptomyces boncukensis]